MHVLTRNPRPATATLQSPSLHIVQHPHGWQILLFSKSRPWTFFPKRMPVHRRILTNSPVSTRPTAAGASSQEALRIWRSVHDPGVMSTATPIANAVIAATARASDIISPSLRKGHNPSSHSDHNLLYTYVHIWPVD